jgi:hypothetical protein
MEGEPAQSSHNSCLRRENVWTDLALQFRTFP